MGIESGYDTVSHDYADHFGVCGDSGWHTFDQFESAERERDG